MNEDAKRQAPQSETWKQAVGEKREAGPPLAPAWEGITTQAPSAPQPREEEGLTGLNYATGGGGAGHRPRPWTHCPVLFPALSAAPFSSPLTRGGWPGTARPQVYLQASLPFLEMACSDARGWTPPSGLRNWGVTGPWRLSAFHRGGKSEAQRAEGIGPAATGAPPPSHLLQPWH